MIAENETNNSDTKRCIECSEILPIDRFQLQQTGPKDRRKMARRNQCMTCRSRINSWSKWMGRAEMREERDRIEEEAIEKKRMEVAELMDGWKR